ncbi:uncharacterized protein LOC130636609 [Hydractinia symbiolongicarpus]|uniref:uncharacterized protein LOC130636609 n=1 Tax=Hydractinia symbiolongicarpus TaxID=13093 RepID=UPI00254C6C7B|nr:uncharacterized protein LOC130636609 [Hydractinia symbiolongicarpus]
MTNNELTGNKKAEKPSFLSKRVLRTQKRNAWESLILSNQQEQLDKQKWNRYATHFTNMSKMTKVITGIRSVKERAPVSPERRRFLAGSGFTVKEKCYDMNDFLSLMDDVIYPVKKNKEKKGFDEKERALLRLNSFTKKKDSLEDLIELEEEVRSEDKFVHLDKKPSSTRARPLFIRHITPPLRGREVWKVHQEREEEQRYMTAMQCFHGTDAKSGHKQTGSNRSSGKRDNKPGKQRTSKQKDRDVKLEDYNEDSTNNKQTRKFSVVPDFNSLPKTIIDAPNHAQAIIDAPNHAQAIVEAPISQHISFKSLLKSSAAMKDNQTLNTADSIPIQKTALSKETNFTVNKNYNKNVRIHSARKQPARTYSQMQLNVSGRCFSVFVPKFSKNHLKT